MESIAVIGSASQSLPQEIRRAAYELGQEIALQGFTLLTGAACGVGYEATRGAKFAGGRTIGISPAAGTAESSRYGTMEDELDSVIYTGMGYKGRNVILVRTCNGLIAVNGGFGTLNEITIAQGEGKPVVVIEGTGGASGLAAEIFRALDPNCTMFAAAKGPKEAVAKLSEMMRQRDPATLGTL